MDDLQRLVEHLGPGPGVELLAESGQLLAAVVEAETYAEHHAALRQQVEGGQLASDDPGPAASQRGDHGTQPQAVVAAPMAASVTQGSSTSAAGARYWMWSQRNRPSQPACSARSAEVGEQTRVGELAELWDEQALLHSGT